MDFGKERITAVALFVLLLCFGGWLIEHKQVCQSSTGNTGCLTLEEPLFDDVPDDGLSHSEFDETTNLEKFRFRIMHDFPNAAGVNTMRVAGLSDEQENDRDEPMVCSTGYTNFGYGCCEKWNSRCTASGSLPLYDMSLMKNEAICEADHEKCEDSVTSVEGRVNGDSNVDGELLYGTNLPTTASGVTNAVLQGNWTIMATIFLDGHEQHDGEHYGSLFSASGSCGKDNFQIGVKKERTIEFRWGEEGIDFDFELDVKTWYHIAITFSGYKMPWRQWAQPLLYVNGALNTQNYNNGENTGSGWGPYEGTITSDFRVGGFKGVLYPNGPYHDLLFHGGLKNVEVYSRALNLPEIANRAGAFADADHKRADHIIFSGPYGQSWIEKPCSSDADCEEFGGKKCLVANRSLAEGAELPEHCDNDGMLGQYRKHPGFSKMNIKRCRPDVYYLSQGATCGRNIAPDEEFTLDDWRKNADGNMAETVLKSALSCPIGNECVDKDAETDSCHKCKAEVYNEHGQICASVAAGNAVWYENTNSWTNLQTSCKNGTNFDLTKTIEVADACGSYESNTMGDGTGSGSNRSNDWKTILGNAQTADTAKDASKVALRLHIKGPLCSGKNETGARCESDSDCTSNYCNPYVDSQSETPWKTCGARPGRHGGCCKAGWTVVTQGLRGIGHAYCCPPNYNAGIKKSTTTADAPTADPPLLGCYRPFGQKTLSETQKICQAENDLNELMTVGMPTISGKANAAEYAARWPAGGVWTGTQNLDFGGKQKYVEEATHSYACSDYVSELHFGPLLTASGVPVAMHCQQLGCGYKDCLIAKDSCDSGTGLRKDRKYMCGSPESVADMGVPFLIFTLVILFLIVGLCFLPCFSGQSKSMVQQA